MSSYIPIASVTLSSTSTVTFSSIPTTVGSKTIRDLVFIIQAGSQDVYAVINNDTSSSSYPAVLMGALAPNTFYSASRTTRTKLELAGTAWGGNVVFQMLDFAQTDKHKATLTRANGAGVGNNAVEAYAGRWASTSQVTSVRFESLSGGGFAAGSTFSLYGIEG